MAELRARFRSLDDVAAPDVWRRTEGLGPRFPDPDLDVPTEAGPSTVGRLAIVAFVLVLTAAATGFVVHGFGDRPVTTPGGTSSGGVDVPTPSVLRGLCAALGDLRGTLTQIRAGTLLPEEIVLALDRQTTAAREASATRGAETRRAIRRSAALADRLRPAVATAGVHYEGDPGVSLRLRSALGAMDAALTQASCS